MQFEFYEHWYDGNQTLPSDGTESIAYCSDNIMPNLQGRKGWLIGQLHITLTSSSQNTVLWYMVKGLYMQGKLVWDGTKSQEATLDIPVLFRKEENTEFEGLILRDLNSAGITIIGSNTSLSRYKFLFLPD